MAIELFSYVNNERLLNAIGITHRIMNFNVVKIIMSYLNVKILIHCRKIIILCVITSEFYDKYIINRILLRINCNFNCQQKILFTLTHAHEWYTCMQYMLHVY